MNNDQTVQLSASEQDLLLGLAHDVSRYQVVDNTEEHVTRAQTLVAYVPEHIRRAALRFRRYGDDTGGWLLTGLPTGAVPRTPSHADLAVGTTVPAAGIFAILAALLGDQFGFRPELSGNLIQDILPVRGFEDSQQSLSSTTDLYPHVEHAFTDNRADYVGLFCLRPDHDGIAGTTLSPIEAIMARLDDATVEVLRQPRYETTVDASFLRGTGRTSPVLVGPVRVLSGGVNRPRVRCDFAETTGLDPIAVEALERLRVAAVSTARTVYLHRGDMLWVDNHFALHGRTAFRPRWDGQDRWLLRTFVTRDLSRSATDRPDDGRIVDVGYLSPLDVSVP